MYLHSGITLDSAQEIMWVARDQIQVTYMQDMQGQRVTTLSSQIPVPTVMRQNANGGCLKYQTFKPGVWLGDKVHALHV